MFLTGVQAQEASEPSLFFCVHVSVALIILMYLQLLLTLQRYCTLGLSWWAVRLQGPLAHVHFNQNQRCQDYTSSFSCIYFKLVWYLVRATRWRSLHQLFCTANPSGLTHKEMVREWTQLNQSLRYSTCLSDWNLRKSLHCENVNLVFTEKKMTYLHTETYHSQVSS